MPSRMSWLWVGATELKRDGISFCIISVNTYVCSLDGNAVKVTSGLVSMCPK